jgi:hypothetical protein
MSEAFLQIACFMIALVYEVLQPALVTTRYRTDVIKEVLYEKPAVGIGEFQTFARATAPACIIPPFLYFEDLEGKSLRGYPWSSVSPSAHFTILLARRGLLFRRITSGNNRLLYRLFDRALS